MSDGFVQVPVDSSGKKVDTAEITVGANTVERQRIVLADNATAAAVAAVENTDPGSTDYGLVVRTVRGVSALPLRVDPTGTTAQPVSGTVTANIAGTQVTITKVLQATASGDTALWTPTAGKAVRLYRVELSNSHATTALTVGLNFGGGTTFGKAYIPAAGGANVKNFGDNYLQGTTNQVLNVNLSATGQVEVTAYGVEV